MSGLPVLAACSAAAGCFTAVTLLLLLRKESAARAAESELASRRAEQTLLRLLGIIDVLPDGVIEVGADGLVKRLNVAATRLTGWKSSDAMGRRPEQVFPLCDHGVAGTTERLIATAMAGSNPGQISGAEALTKSGAAFYVDCSAAPLIAGNRSTAGVVLVFRETGNRPSDVTSQRLAAIVENSDDAIVGKTLEGIVTSWNRSAERIFGYTAAEMIGSPISRLIPESDAEDMHQILHRIARGEAIDQFVTRRLTRDGRLIVVSLKVSPIRDRTGRIVGASKIARDITHQLLLEERVEQAQKLEVIGQLAGGLAHDFNNLLTVINGYANLAQTQLPAEDPVQTSLRHIESAGDRAVEMTRQLLAFSRKQLLRPQRLQLNNVVEALHPMFTRLVKENITFSFHLGQGLSHVQADRTQLEQVLLNLVVNAGDAMPEGGKITIETGEALLDKTYTSQRSDVQPGRYMMVAVTDSGTGISREVGKRIFEPFFTTKPPGKGTGLGLSTAYGIVKQSGGHLAFYSEPGLGTTFRVYLPVADEEAGDSVPEQVPDAVCARGTESILVVEDDTALLRFTAITLRELGYTVYSAAPGKEALRVARTLGQGLHLLVTDVVMPEIGGRRLAAMLQAEVPGLKVLYMSGYAENGITHQGVLEADVAFLPKPFRAEQLARRVREVLEQHGTVSAGH
jgi:two-component system cell cycle sensor histidine kinase/response regulator CckA